MEQRSNGERATASYLYYRHTLPVRVMHWINVVALTILVMAQAGILGETIQSPVDLSYLADTVVLLRYFEAFGEVRKALSVVKRRTGTHERNVRELRIAGDRLFVSREIRIEQRFR